MAKKNCSESRLTRILKAKRISNVALASAMNVRAETVSRWKLGKLNITSQNATKLSEYLNVPIEYLTGYEDSLPADFVQTNAISAEVQLCEYMDKIGCPIDQLDAIQSRQCLDEIKDFIQFVFTRYSNDTKGDANNGKE